MGYFIDRFHTTFLEGLQLHFRGQSSFFVVMHHTNHLSSTIIAVW